MRQSFLSYAMVCITFIHLVHSISTSAKSRNATRTDPMKCKLTQLGIEYSGFAATTSSGIRCQPWFSEQPLHKVSEDIKDADFPERSMRLAKNYCRNPTRDARGPWCYTMEPTLIDDACNVPLCHYGECRISGPGAEYGGTRKMSSSRRECKSWDKRQKLIDGQTDKFDDSRFSDLSRQKAKSFCRNPDGSTSGPWCYVERDDYETVEKEHCDIPFCDDKDCLVYVRNASTYSTVTALNATLGNVTFWLKLWNPGDERKGEAKLLLSVLPIPASAERIAQDWRAGVEIAIGNSGSGQSYPNVDGQRDFEETPDVLSGSKWNGFWVTWGGGFISVGRYGTSKPLFADEYKKKKNSAVSLYPDGFLYYGIMGTGVLWSTEFCQDACEVHTTHGLEFLRVWPLVRTNDTYDLQFHVRASRNAVIRLYQSPGAPFPRFTLTIGDADTVTVEYQEGESTGSLHLGDVPRKGLLDFWSWKEFTLSIFGEELRLYSRRTYGSEEDVRVNHRLIGTLRWFSVGSTETVAHWSLSCSPGEAHAVEEPWTPNCIATTADYRYEGSQWTGADQVPCVPWISKEIPENERGDALFVDGSAVKALNKCRNPTKDPEGPFCYAITSRELPASKSYCPVRKCRSSDCRMSGTADDYVGTLSVTRSGRTCAKWLSDYDAEELARAKAGSAKKKPGDAPPPPPRNTSTPKNPYPRPVHPVEPVYFNDTLYPERNVTNAVNYCRDPSRNIAGTWCYTTDPRVPRDLCNVRDCTKPEECTFFVKGHGLGRRLYILPEYRSEGLLFSLKEWEPSRPDSITFVFTADDGLKSRYILKIGAANNEKVLLYHQSETEGIKLVKKKTLPHLLYLGRWSSFRLRIPRGRVEVYYEGAPTPLFEWEHPELAKAFVPIYYYYASELGNTIGVAFDCNAKCHVENTETDRFTRILPLSMWRKEETPNPDGIVLMIRAKGVVLIPLLMLPSTPGSYGLSLGEAGHWILFLKNLYPNVRIYHKQKSPGPLFTNDTWTNITLRWYDRTLDVYRNETLVFHYVHREPLLFYFFSLAVDFGGWAIWAANCIPSDIDGDPEDGGWSEWGPWSCSVSCGGGVGTRKRICDSPEPNVRGEPCTGPDITSGRCNENVCGDVSSDTISLITKRIRKNHTALTAREGRAVIVPCDRDVVTAIASESPDSEIQWSRNGIFLKETRGRVEIKDYDIVINRAILNDSGIYTIVLHRVDESRLIFKVVSLAVEPVESVSIVRETLPLVLTCHCVVLGYVYSNLKISWTIDDRPWKDYGTTLPIAVNVDRVPAINYSHRGTWRCVVEQNDLDFRWTSNVVTVKVIGPPNWRSHLMEDKFTKPIFGWMPNESFVAVAALVLFAMLTCCIVAGAVALIRFRDSLKFKGFGTTAGKKGETASTKSKLRRGLETIQFPSPKKRGEQRTNGERLRGESEMGKPSEGNLQIRGKRKGGGKNGRAKDAAESRKLIVDSETEE